MRLYRKLSFEYGVPGFKIIKQHNVFIRIYLLFKQASVYLIIEKVIKIFIKARYLLVAFKL